jgi:UV DNA damage repair endonuclease
MLSAELLDANRLHVTIPFLRSIAHLDTDVMLESKAKDLALLRLRADIARCPRPCRALRHLCRIRLR